MNETRAAFPDLTGGQRSSKLGLLEIFLGQQPRLRRIAAGMGLSASDVEDVLQDVSIRALKGPVNSQSKEQSARWLIRVTLNRCLTEHRRRRSFKRHTGEILKRRSQKAAAAEPAEKAIQAEELEIMRRNLQKLDDSLLPPLVLRYFCDLNSKEIAEILDLPASTVRSRLRDARMILAKDLLKRGVEPQ
ncbi:MAG TPA: RNA polymerase sigma factor [Sedimentisphaerales bacterium]|nr:RNA polymerase sigma factor [Sedimentisphaerales bacterium]